MTMGLNFFYLELDYQFIFQDFNISSLFIIVEIVIFF